MFYVVLVWATRELDLKSLLEQVSIKRFSVFVINSSFIKLESVPTAEISPQHDAVTTTLHQRDGKVLLSNYSV